MNDTLQKLLPNNGQPSAPNWEQIEDALNFKFPPEYNIYLNITKQRVLWARTELTYSFGL